MIADLSSPHTFLCSDYQLTVHHRNKIGIKRKVDQQKNISIRPTLAHRRLTLLLGRGPSILIYYYLYQLGSGLVE